jgi:hypothetical protein
MRRTAVFPTLLLLALATTATAQQTDDLIIPRSGAARVLIPIAGATEGNGGTFFRSDVHLINLRNVPQRVELYWMPQGAAGAVTPRRVLDIPPLAGIFSEDFVTNIMQAEGLGGIQIIGVTEDGGQFDAGALIHVTSRIWTPRPDGAPGTYSQTFPGVILPSGAESNTRAIFGLRHGPRFRLNVGIANTSAENQRFRVTVRVSTPTNLETTAFEVQMLPRSVEQRNVGVTADGVVQVLVERLTGGTAIDYQAWASSVDNDSGDAWSNLGFPVQ